MNIINWAKGVDGQLPGFVSVSCLFIAVLANQFADAPTQFNDANLALIVAGAYAGLLVWNFYPQKIMPGYGAGSLAGYFLSVLAILSGAKVATTLMVLAIPTADGIFTIVRRILAGKSPFWGDRGHLHHKLMDDYGWGKRKIAVFYTLASAALGLLSLYLSTTGKIIAIASTTIIVFVFLIYTKLNSK
jgi:UDP-GlcNAc:undecaprenyl-phosphate GlcNAc-1-phosphate transferase